MPYKFEPSEALALYASIMTGAEIGQMRHGSISLSEFMEYHLSMVAIAIVSLARYDEEVAHTLFITLGENLGDMITEELSKRDQVTAAVMEELDKLDENNKTEAQKREEEFLRNVKEQNKYKM